jgi:hypothetical protein
MGSEVGFFNPWRLKWYPRFALFSIIAALLISVVGGRGAESPTGRLGADFPAFYGAGLALKQGEGRSLYSLDHQRQMQAGLFPPGLKGNVMPFPYPAFVAVAYYPFVYIPYRVSFLLHSLLMIMAVIVTVHLLARLNTYVSRYHELALAAFVLYYPVLRSELGGQNTAITLLLFVAVWLFSSQRKEWLAGVFLGSMLFKPQYGIPLIGLHLLAGRWRTAITGSLAGLFLYGVGAYFCGVFWVKDWLQYAAWVSRVAAIIDGPISISWLGFLQAILGEDSLLASIFGWVLAIATVLAVSFVWCRGRRNRDLSLQFATAAPALLLMQPHAMFYDMGLVLFSYAVFLHLDKGGTRRVALMWLLGLTQIAAKSLGFSPLFLVLLLTGLPVGRLWLYEVIRGAKTPTISCQKRKM